MFKNKHLIIVAVIIVGLWLLSRPTKETYYNPRLNYVPGSWDDYAKGYEAKNDPYNGPNRKEYYMRTKPWQPYQGYEQNISFP